MLKNKAFTLAETVITIAIIGIISAITIPPLAKNFEKHTVEVRLKNFYSEINKAIKLSEIENGSAESWDLTSETGEYDSEFNVEFFNKYLKNYLNFRKIEQNADGQVIPNISYNYAVVYLADGSIFTLRIVSGIDIIYFPFSENTNSDSRHRFVFSFLKSGSSYSTTVEPYSYNWDGTRSNLIEHERYGCYRESPSYNFCAKLIQYEGWKISGDYPW